MSYDQYWYGDVWLVEAYREADKLYQERTNEACWLQGMYVHEAVGVALANAFKKPGSALQKYSNQPYDFTGKREKTEKEIAREEENDRLKAMLYMNNMVRAGKNWSNGG